MNSEIVALAFTDGSILTSGSTQVVIRVCDLGKISLPTGKIVSCDPIDLYDMAPFEQKVSVGQYPIFLSIGKAISGRTQRVAMAMLQLSEEKPVQWVLANRLGDNPEGYGVDVALGGFMDLSAAELLYSKQEAEEGFHNAIFEAVEDVDTEGAIVEIDETSALNIAIFSTGFGDGFYKSYWGYAQSGEIVCLVTDFAILGESPNGYHQWAWV